ncbi:MAG: hypothetical protein MZV63_29955 [Marinilabiliales bacterium]|nr:hypothetical protein [Marinilabiliales bacterium]
MKKITLSMLLLAFLVPAGAQTNDFYDDAPTNPLKGSKKILVTGEVVKDVTVDIAKLPLHSITVKETTLTDGQAGIYGSIPV